MSSAKGDAANQSTTQSSKKSKAKASAGDTGTQYNISDVDQAKVDKKIYLYTGISTGAAVLPTPMLDMAALAGIQLLLINDLTKIYGVPFKESAGKSLVAVLLTTIPTHTVSSTTSSLLKIVPVIGSVLGGLSLIAVYSAATFAIGKVFSQHFASGGTMLTFNAEKMKTAFKQYFDQKLESEAGV